MTLHSSLVRLFLRSRPARLLPAVRRQGDAAAFLHHYSTRVLTARTGELQEAASLLEPHGPDVIDLASGSPAFDLVPSTSTKLPADRRSFPPPAGLMELRAAVADHVRANHGLDIDPGAEVLVTHGVTGAFHAALDAFVNPGDAVLLFDPASPLYRLGIYQKRARIRSVPTWTEDGRTRFPFDRLLTALRGARLLVVNSPANPTGGVIAPDDMEQIAWWADRHDVLIFSDEAFARFRFQGQAVSIGALTRARDRTVTAGSVSKGYALTSARVGWLAGHRHLVRACMTTAALRTPFVPTICQQIAVNALRQGSVPFQPILAAFESRRRYGYERLQAAGLNPAWPAGAFFFFWFPVNGLGITGREFAEQLLRSKKVLVWGGDSSGPCGDHYVRLSFAAEDGRLREGLSRIADFVRESKGVSGTVVKQAA